MSSSRCLSRYAFVLCDSSFTKSMMSSVSLFQSYVVPVADWELWLVLSNKRRPSMCSSRRWPPTFPSPFSCLPIPVYFLYFPDGLQSIHPCLSVLHFHYIVFSHILSSLVSPLQAHKLSICRKKLGYGYVFEGTSR